MTAHNDGPCIYCKQQGSSGEHPAPLRPTFRLWPTMSLIGFEFTVEDDKEARLFTFTDEPLAGLERNVGSSRWGGRKAVWHLRQHHSRK
jgi:hypothetical protein